MVRARNEKELGKALKNEVDEIEISADLETNVYKIKARGKVAWLVALGAIGTAVAFLLASPETMGISAIAAAPTFLAASTALGGASVATSAIMIAVAAGGVGALNSLRNYNLVKENGKAILRRK